MRNVRHTSKMILIALVLGTTTMLVGQSAQAAEPVKKNLFSQFLFGFNATADAAYPETKPQALNVQIITYINFLLALTGIVFLALMLYAGWTLLMARGNEEQIEKSKSIIRQATIGFLSILIARIFTEFVITQLFAALSTTPAAGN